MSVTALPDLLELIPTHSPPPSPTPDPAADLLFKRGIGCPPRIDRSAETGFPVHRDRSVDSLRARVIVYVRYYVV